MESNHTTLEEAISLVNKERSYLCEECRAYEAFREQIRLTSVDSTDATGPSDTTERLLAAYREAVMEPLDYETIYGDTVAESIEAELSPAIAQMLLSKEPLTQRRKRTLLLQTTAAIERREEFIAELDDERAALETYAEELADIEVTLQNLPVCSAHKHPFEKLIVVWEVYDMLQERCEQLLERRQQQLWEAERNVGVLREQHARNVFLYSELETQYPVLAAIATMCDRIDSKRNGEHATEAPERTLEC